MTSFPDNQTNNANIKEAGLFERLVFRNRVLILILGALITVLLAWQATGLQVNASFEKMVPQSHPYMKNFFENQSALPGAGNAIQVVVEHSNGSIFDKDYLKVVQDVNDTLYLMPGVDRAWMRSIWTRNLRWTEVTEEGYQGGPVMPESYDGSAASMDQLSINIARAGIVGRFVAGDMKSTLIFVPLLDMDPATGEPLDYGAFSRQLEQKIRSMESDDVKIHIVGFAKVIGDLIAGLGEVVKYFAISVLVSVILVFLYIRCLRSALLLAVFATLGSVWLLGLLALFGFSLDPFSVLVPFLVFAIGMSHGAQQLNHVIRGMSAGASRYEAARGAFRGLLRVGLAALISNVLAFAILVVIDIPIIRELVIITSLGMGVLIVTKLILLPVTLSYVGVGAAAIARAQRPSRHEILRALWSRLVSFTEPRKAVGVLMVALLVLAGGLYARQGLQIGNHQGGAPELRPDSRYNQDNAYLSSHYSLSTDQFITILKTPPGGCEHYETLIEADRLGVLLDQVEGVQTTFSTADGTRRALSGMVEGNPKWLSITRNASNLTRAVAQFRTDRPDLVDRSCAVTPVVAYLNDSKAQTLQRVVSAVEDFAAEHNTADRQFLLAAGNAGIAATVNIVVAKSSQMMQVLIYATIALVCLIAFRSWRAVVVALIPLGLTSVLSEALMVPLGIGVTVATLPVIAIGVGLGVDYALYLLSVQLRLQRQGVSLREAYRQCLDTTGRIVALVGFTMAAGVITWSFSPIQFQADMGKLLTFMLLGNMVGALVLIPALSHFLLRGERAVALSKQA